MSNGLCCQKCLADVCICPQVTGRKDDHGKDPWDLVPWSSFLWIPKVLAFGANEYGIDNWKVVPQSRRRYFAAAMRHLLSWFTGERLDKKSGLPHLAHAITCLLFLLWFDEGTGKPSNADQP